MAALIGIPYSYVAPLGMELKVLYDPERTRPDKSEVMRLISNNDKAKTLMKWVPKIDIDTGLKVVKEYVKKYIHEYKSDRYNV